MDLGEVAAATARRIPLTTWFRFRRAVEATPTVLVAIEQQPLSQSCASLVLRLSQKGRLCARASEALPARQQPQPAHASLLRGLEYDAHVVRSPGEQRKPSQAVNGAFASRTVWTG